MYDVRSEGLVTLMLPSFAVQMPKSAIMERGDEPLSTRTTKDHVGRTKSQVLANHPHCKRRDMDQSVSVLKYGILHTCLVSFLCLDPNACYLSQREPFLYRTLPCSVLPVLQTASSSP